MMRPITQSETILGNFFKNIRELKERELKANLVAKTILNFFVQSPNIFGFDFTNQKKVQLKMIDTFDSS